MKTATWLNFFSSLKSPSPSKWYKFENVILYPIAQTFDQDVLGALRLLSCHLTQTSLWSWKRPKASLAFRKNFKMPMSSSCFENSEKLYQSTQVYMGQLRNKCVLDIEQYDEGNGPMNWTEWVLSEENWYIDDKGNPELCGNATGAKWVF